METNTVGAPPCPCTQNTAQPLSLECRIALLQTNTDRLNYRLGYSEVLHRKVDERGDIEHYEFIAPQVAKAAAIGALLAVGVYGGIMTIINYVKKK